MQDVPTPSSPRKPAQKPVAKGRDERLKAALKANMARRKAQAKVRAATPGADEKEDE